MSTRSKINLKITSDQSVRFIDGTNMDIKQGQYLSIYVHFDGYTRHLGKMLLKYFNNYEAILDLLKNGDCSCLNDDGTVVAYYSEPFNEGMHFRISAQPTEEEYTYVYEDEKWKVKLWRDDYHDLTPELIEQDY